MILNAGPSLSGLTGGIPFPGAGRKRRLGNLPHRAGWLSQPHLGFARGPGLRAGLRSLPGAAGGNGKSRSHFRHHRRRSDCRSAQSQRYPSHRIRRSSRWRPLCFDQQPGQSVSAGRIAGIRRHLRERRVRRQGFFPLGTRRIPRRRQCRTFCPQRQRGQSRPQLEPMEAGRSEERSGSECPAGALRAMESRAARRQLPRRAWTA